MGYRHTKHEILGGALAVAFDDGLSRLTYGRVAKQLGISDRVVVYYFPSKEDLVGEVLLGVGIQLQQALAPAFRSPAKDSFQLVKAAWPMRSSPCSWRRPAWLRRDKSHTAHSFLNSSKLGSLGRPTTSRAHQLRVGRRPKSPLHSSTAYFFSGKWLDPPQPTVPQRRSVAPVEAEVESGAPLRWLRLPHSFLIPAPLVPD